LNFLKKFKLIFFYRFNIPKLKINKKHYFNIFLNKKYILKINFYYTTSVFGIAVVVVISKKLFYKKYF